MRKGSAAIPHATRWFVAAVAVALAVRAALPWPLARLLTTATAPLLSTAAIMLGIRWNRPRRPYPWLLLAGFGPLIASDAGYSIGVALHSEVVVGLAGAGWVLFCLGLGAAALHPSMARLDEPVRPAGPWLTVVRIAVPMALPLAAVTAAIVLDDSFSARTAPLLVTSTMVLLWLLLVLRVHGMVRALRAVVEENAELHRRATDERFQRLVQNASDVVTVVDAELRIQYQTPAVERVLGYRPDELTGRPLLDLVHPEDAAIAAAVVLAYRADGRPPSTMECRLRRRDGSYLHAETVTAVADTDPPQYVLTTRDVTERHQLQERLRHQAFHDALTGLANRELFADRVRHALARRGLADAPLAVLFLDLDDFKTINDSLGHQVGDQFLIAVADRLRDCLRPSDTPARLGGDEFAVLLEDVAGVEEASQIAERILAALHRPFPVGEREVLARASAGIAAVDLDRVPRAEDLLRDAEAAMYSAKASRRGGYAIFTPDMHDALLHKLDLTAQLRAGLAGDQFRVHYQPIVALADGRIVGVEALARWEHPTRGMVSPAEFIPLAEESGLIVALGRYVLEQACTDGARWLRAGTPVTINVNLSLRQLQEDAFTAEVAAVLAQTGLPAGRLTLEITESFLADEGQETIERLARLKALGVKLAIDDFGTGYSSLSRLRQFPIDVLKIPKPFVDGLMQGADHSAVARTITELGGTLGLDVVAEGIEHREQWVALRRMSCRYGQGFLFARPAPAEAVEPLLEHGRLTGGSNQVRSLRADHRRPRSA